ncbi:neutral zinc metallopeptidase, partial [Acinetobacter baumannii]
QLSAPSAQVGQQQAGTDTASSCRLNAQSLAACNAFSSADKTWAKLLGSRFEPPKLVFYARDGRSGCGAAQSAMGPFYCPRDQGIYLDTS